MVRYTRKQWASGGIGIRAWFRTMFLKRIEGSSPSSPTYMNGKFLKKKRVYLDWAAATPVCKPALRAGNTARRATYGNPSSPHTEGRYARELLEEARGVIARYVEAKPDDVIFTSGATEANALAILGHMRALVASGRAPRDIHFLYASTAHTSIVHTAQALKEEGFAVEALPITLNGNVDIKTLRAMLRPQTALVSMEAVCGETGTVWNTREVKNALRVFAQENRENKNNASVGARASDHAGAGVPAPAWSLTLLHVDASAAPLTQNITRAHWSADMLVFDAQKMCGERGIGALVSHRTIALSPLVHGGPQERSIRPGTQPVALATSFAQAFRYCDTHRARFSARALQARALLIHHISKLPHTFINETANIANTVPHILNISFIGRDTDYLTILLDEAGFAVSTKSACETNTIGSRVVTQLTRDPQRGASTLRVSWGQTTTLADIHRFIKALINAVAFLDEHAL